MATLTVRKDGSGSNTQIMGAIYDAVDGDIIDIGPGTFNENIELRKSITLQGAGKDLTIIQGKYAADTFNNATWYAGDDVITLSSTLGLIKGRTVTSSYFTSNSRVSEIINGTQIKLSLATAVTGNITKTGCTWSSGISTITLPSTTSVIVGMKVEGTGVNATVTAYNATTRVVTLSTPTTQAGNNATLIFRVLRSGQTITMASQFTGSTFPATIQVMNVATNGIAIKNIKIIGFDGITSTEGAAICFTTPASGSHQNWLIDNCRIVADGDCAMVTSPNLPSNGGTVQNCIFEGKTFTGTEPAEVPAFSSFSLNNCQILSSTTISVPNTLGIYPGTASTGSPISGTGIPSSTVVTAINGNVLTVNKTLTGTINSIITCTFSNVQFAVPNVARQLVVIGNSGSVTNCLNTTFKNNTINGDTGAVISSSGNKSMFNTAVTVDTVGGLIENNTINGNFGKGDPNPLVSNFALRSRGANVVVQNNINDVRNGRGNSGFYVPGIGSINLNNITISINLVQIESVPVGQPIPAKMDVGQVTSSNIVSSSPTFSNQTNWKQVSYIFKHTASAKRIVASFKDFTLGAKVNIKLKGALSGEKYELIKMIIKDSSRNLLVLNRTEIDNASSMDITIS